MGEDLAPIRASGALLIMVMPERATRVKLATASVSSLDGTCEAAVTLLFRDASEEGKSACEGSDSSSQLRAVAEATIDAARKLVKGRFTCVVRLAEIADIAGSEFALVNATLTTAGKSVPVLGSCLVRGDVAEAAARATLDAVNRWLDLSVQGVELDGFDELPNY